MPETILTLTAHQSVDQKEIKLLPARTCFAAAKPATAIITS